MTYKILPTKEFSAKFEKLDEPLKERIKKKAKKIARNPARYKFLKHDLKGSSRFRAGKFRIIFSFNINKKELYLETVVFKHRYR